MDEGKELYKSSVAVGKRLVIIPNGNHENLHIMGEAVYYAGLKEFIENHA